MQKRMIFFSIILRSLIVMCFVTFPVTVTADDGIRIGYGNEIPLDASVREVAFDTMFEYVQSEYDIPFLQDENIDLPVLKQDVISALYKHQDNDISNTDREAVTKWAEDEMLVDNAGIVFDNENISAANVVMYLYKLAHKIIMTDEPADLPVTEDSPYYYAFLWAADKGLFTEEEAETGFNIYGACTGRQLVGFLYYNDHPRVYSYHNFPITVDEFLQSCQNVVDTARLNGYVYGNSTAANPTTDGIISCDRLIAKALYDLGYTDQRRGGEVCGSLDAWLSAHGFERSTSIYDAKRGSIMLVSHKGKDHCSHAFVLASDFDFQAMKADRYDTGSNGFIRSQQPLRSLGFWYRTDHIVVYNIPE